jgi:hypothetical protein
MAEKDEKNGADKGEFKPEFEIVEQGTQGAEKTESTKDEKVVKAGYEDDERLSAAQRDDDDEHADEPDKVEADKGEQTAEEIEAKRERRRRERKAQKARQKFSRERDDREMNFLRVRNEQLEKAVGSISQRVTNNEMSQVEGRLEQLRAARNEAEEVLARAIEANNGSDVVKLNRTIRELEAGITRLTGYKGELEKQKTAQANDGEADAEGGRVQDRGTTPRPPASVLKNVQIFGGRHPWFNPQGTDEDSAITRALDAAVLAEGFDPGSKDYWAELEERMARRLPERMKAFRSDKTQDDNDDADEGDDPQPQRRNGSGAGKPAGKSGPRMSSGSQTRGSGKQFLLSAERKTAMIEAGVWDDPELRDKYIRSYATWDKANPAPSGR